jgi:hypothetical protein
MQHSESRSGLLACITECSGSRADSRVAGAPATGLAGGAGGPAMEAPLRTGCGTGPCSRTAAPARTALCGKAYADEDDPTH